MPEEEEAPEFNPFESAERVDMERVPDGYDVYGQLGEDYAVAIDPETGDMLVYDALTQTGINTTSVEGKQFIKKLVDLNNQARNMSDQEREWVGNYTQAALNFAMSGGSSNERAALKQLAQTAPESLDDQITDQMAWAETMKTAPAGNGDPNSTTATAGNTAGDGKTYTGDSLREATLPWARNPDLAVTHTTSEPITSTIKTRELAPIETETSLAPSKMLEPGTGHAGSDAETLTKTYYGGDE